MAKKGKSDKWIVLSRNPNKKNRVVRVWRRKKGVDENGEKIYKYKHSQENPNKDAKNGKWKCRFDKKSAAQAAKDWSEKKGNVCYMSKDQWPFLVLGDKYEWGATDKFNKDLNRIAKRCQRYMRVLIKRPKKEAYNLRMAYLNGTGNLAAQCCNYTGKHSWEQCQKSLPNSCYSNHCAGKASDSSIYSQGRSGTITSIGSWGNGKGRSEAKKVGMCLPVVGEPWHLEHGSTWRA